MSYMVYVVGETVKVAGADHLYWQSNPEKRVSHHNVTQAQNRGMVELGETQLPNILGLEIELYLEPRGGFLV